MVLRVRSIASWKRLYTSLLALLLIVAFGSTGVHAAEQAQSGSGYRFKDKERCLMRKINKARYNRGRRKLGWDKQMGYVARRHAGKMSAARGVWHDDVAGKITRWRRLGQNVGRGMGCRHLFRGFMRSSGHRANILGRWKFVGVGVARSGGRLYAAQIFESRRDPGNIYHYP